MIFFFLIIGCEISPHELLRDVEVRAEGRGGDNRCHARLDRDRDEEGQVHDGRRCRDAMEGRTRSKIIDLPHTLLNLFYEQPNIGISYKIV